MSNIDAIKEIEELARQSPSGLPDRLAWRKYLKESREFYMNALRYDIYDQALKAADRIYYLVKCRAQGDITDANYIKRVEVVCLNICMPIALCYEICLAKYRHRIGRHINGQAADRDGERQAAVDVINAAV